MKIFNSVFLKIVCVLCFLFCSPCLSDTIPPPFTPVEVQQDNAETNINVWGRTYKLAGSPFLSEIITADFQILAEPIALKLVAEGELLNWKLQSGKLKETRSDKAVYVGSYTADNIKLDLTTEIEYDGFVKVSWQLSSEKPVLIQELVLEIPLKAANAEYLYTWPTVWSDKGYFNLGHSGTLKEDHNSKFKPIVWLGDNERGLSWFCENDQYWSLSDPNAALQVSRSSKQVTVKFNIITKPIRLMPDKPFKYVFAFQATPLRPIEKDCWDFRLTNTWDIYHFLNDKIEDKLTLDYQMEKGVRSSIAFCWYTDIFAYPWPMGHEADFKRVMELCHSRGLKIIPYIGHMIDQKAPEFSKKLIRLPEYINEFGKNAEDPNALKVKVYHQCLKGPWADILVEKITKMLDVYDIDGVYLDTTASPFDCINESHGCGYRKANDTLVPTYPIFAVRDTVKRIYTAVKKRKPDGLIDNHPFDCMNSAALAFCTSYWNGEQLRDPNVFGISLDRFRTEMMGVNWGVPAEFLYYKYNAGEPNEGMAFSLLHDVPVRAIAGNDVMNSNMPTLLWSLMDSFGRKKAQFLPYYSNSDFVKVNGKECYASLYKHPDNGVLIFVSNVGKEQTECKVTLNLKKLGLSSNGFSAVDGLTGEALTFNGDSIKVALNSLNWRYIWLKPKKDSKGTAYMTYKVRKLKEPMPIDANWDKAQWQPIEPLELKLHMGQKPEHFPKVQTKVMYDDENIFVIWRVDDQFVRAVGTKYQDMVCWDSCAEFFFTPTDDPDPATGYFNFEISCIGTVLCFHQKASQVNQVSLKDKDLDQMEIATSLPKKVIDPEIKEPLTWTLEYRIPLKMLEGYHKVIKPAPGVKWKANFYKCADKTSGQHWLTWSLVDLDGPDFHRPEFFGTLEFTN